MDQLNSMLSPDEQRAIEDRAITGDMAEREGLDKLDENGAEAGKPGKDDKEKESGKDGSADDEIPFRPEKQSRRSKLSGRLFNKKTAIGGGIAGLLIGGGFGLFGILSGPLQVIHYSQLLQQFHFTNNDEFANGRTNRYLFHRMKGGTGHAKMQTRLGVVGNRVADVMEIRMQRETGMRPLYDTRTGALVGYEVIDENRMVDTLTNADIDPDTDMDFSDNMNETERSRLAGADGNRPDGSRRILMFRDSNGGRHNIKMRRNFHKSVTRTMNMNRVANAVGFRKSAYRAGLSLSPISRADMRLNQSIADRARAMKDRWRNETVNGRQQAPSVDLRNTNEEGEVDPSSEEADRGGKEAQADARNPDKAEARSRVGSRITVNQGVSIGAIGIGTLCTARSISENIDSIKYANIALPLMRIGTRLVALGDQVRSGINMSMDLLGEASKAFFSEDAGPFIGAMSMQSELGQPLTGADISETARVTRVGQKPKPLEVIDAIFDRARGVGSAACSRIGQFALGALTGGLIATVVEEAIGIIASAANVKQPMEIFTEWITNTLAGDMVDPEPIGMEYGNAANHGTRLAAVEQARTLGGIPLEPDEERELDTLAQASRTREFGQKSFFARVFDVTETNSLFATILFQNQTVAAIRTNPATSALLGIPRIISSLGQGVVQLFSPRAYADQPYDYGFDDEGFTAAEQESELFDDPYENALVVEPMLDVLTQNFGDCFPQKISEDGSIVDNTSYDPTKVDRGRCYDRDNEALTRYRFYIADTILAKSLSCKEVADDTESCAEVSPEITAPASPAQLTNTGRSADYIPDCEVNEGNAKIACVAIDTMLGIPYRNGYSSRPGCKQWPSSSNDPNPTALDCSAFTSMAVYRAFGTDAPRSSVAYLSHANFSVVGDTRNGHVGNIRDIKPGDLVGRGRCASGDGGSCNGHIGIVVSYDPSTHKLVTVETDRCTENSRVVTTKGLEIDGTGDYTWAVRYIGQKNGGGS